jgi:hypothetical protein
VQGESSKPEGQGNKLPVLLGRLAVTPRALRAISIQYGRDRATQKSYIYLDRTAFESLVRWNSSKLAILLLAKNKKLQAARCLKLRRPCIQFLDT